MKYNIKEFNSAVRYYQNALKGIKSKNFLFVFNCKHEAAYYAMAPLSRAVHNLKSDLHVMMAPGTSHSYNVLKDIWKSYDNIRNNKVGKKEAALKEFIDFIDKKAKGKLRRMFEAPVIFEYRAGKFVCGVTSLEIRAGWFKAHRWKELLQTANVLWNQLYDLKKSEIVSLRFELIPKQKDLEKPLVDYLDSYLIARAMYETVKGRCSKVSMGTSTSRMSVLEPSELVGDLKTTLLGCELSKNISEPVFKKFRAVSRLFKISRIITASAIFAISGKGYGGKHQFGYVFGYPTPNKKSRWLSPSGILYKLSWAPQARFDTRKPRSRIGFTQTIPIDDFILTCNIDWLKMAETNKKLAKKADKCEKIVVKGIPVGKYQTDFVVHLVDKKGGRRAPKRSDVDIRNRYDKQFYKKTKIKCGTMANIPGGEMFLTPEAVEGTVVGDVVIAIDDSYRLSQKNPMVINCKMEKYRVVAGPKRVLNILKKKKKDSWNKILLEEKSGAVPKSITNLKKKNFHRIGEFAINTNPKAKLSGYLIVDEKVAGMIHIALGSGFDADRATEYHYDIVCNCRKQKMNIYGLTKSGRMIWMVKQGKLVV